MAHIGCCSAATAPTHRPLSPARGRPGESHREVPREYAELRAGDPARADRWREAIADAFEALPLERGSSAWPSIAICPAYVLRKLTEDAP